MQLALDAAVGSVQFCTYAKNGALGLLRVTPKGVVELAEHAPGFTLSFTQVWNCEPVETEAASWLADSPSYVSIEAHSAKRPVLAFRNEAMFDSAATTLAGGESVVFEAGNAPFGTIVPSSVYVVG